MRKPSIMIMTVALLLGGTTTLTMAGPHGGHCQSKQDRMDKKDDRERGSKMGGGMGHLERFIDRLELDKEQRDKVYGFIDQNRTEMRNLKFDIQDNRQALGALTPSDENYQAQLTELAAKQANLQQTRILKEGELYQQIFSVLDQRQQGKLAGLLETQRK